VRFKCICIAITVLFLARAGISQECPEIKDEKTAAQFLVDHKADSTAADRHCVDGAFTVLAYVTEFQNKNYIEFLVGMLDFERWTPEEYAQASEQKYPAINELHHLHGAGKKVVPYLIQRRRDPLLQYPCLRSIAIAEATGGKRRCPLRTEVTARSRSKTHR
jgi:hypothetical protein